MVEHLIGPQADVDLAEETAESECDDECDCPKCISLDDDMKMLSDTVYCCIGKENIRGLRLAAFDHQDELTRVLTDFLSEHGAA